MTTISSPPPGTDAALLSIGAAVLYAVSMVTMKLLTESPNRMLVALIAVTIAAAAVLELSALRSARLGITYVTILGCEVGIVALASHFGFDERFTAREILGCALIVVGATLVS